MDGGEFVLIQSPVLIGAAYGVWDCADSAGFEVFARVHQGG